MGQDQHTRTLQAGRDGKGTSNTKTPTTLYIVYDFDDPLPCHSPLCSPRTTQMILVCPFRGSGWLIGKDLTVKWALEVSHMLDLFHAIITYICGPIPCHYHIHMWAYSMPLSHTYVGLFHAIITYICGPIPCHYHIWAYSMPLSHTYVALFHAILTYICGPNVFS